MAEKPARPGILRIIAAVFLGIVVGFFVFFAITLVLGAMNIPVSMAFAENIYSAILLIISLAVCLAGFLWLVWTNPPTEPVSGEIEPTSEEFED